MKVTRADWAASVPWTGITGKPDFTNGSGATDIGQLSAAGFSNGNIPVWNATRKKFLPGTLPSPSPTPSPDYTEFFFEWNPPSIHPLQSAWEDFPAIGFTINQVVDVGPPYNVTGCNVLGFISDNDTLRIQVQNITLSDVDLGDGIWRVRIYS